MKALNSGWVRRGISTLAIAAVAMLSTACGEMTTRTWINLVEEESGGSVTIRLGRDSTFDMLRLQGGFFATVKMNTLDLPGPMHGTIVLEDVRMAGEIEGLLGRLCTWNDPNGASTGEMEVDLLGGTTTSSLYLDALATTQFSESLGIPPIDFEQAIDFDLGDGLGIDTFINIFLEGSPAGMFNAESVLTSEIDMAGINTVFEMRTVISNGTEPPVFDDDLLAYCEGKFAQQGLGTGTFFGINSKSSYLRLNPRDAAKDPLAIDLAQIGAQPGDTLSLTALGTYAIIPLFKDGTDRQVGGVFSSTDEVLPGNHLFRIPGAIDAGPNINTWPSIICIFGVCDDLGGDDVYYDFPFHQGLNVTVPAGANFLFVAPIEGFRNYQDNAGMGFGVEIDVIPAI